MTSLEQSVDRVRQGVYVERCRLINMDERLLDDEAIIQTDALFDACINFECAANRLLEEIAK